MTASGLGRLVGFHSSSGGTRKERPFVRFWDQQDQCQLFNWELTLSHSQSFIRMVIGMCHRLKPLNDSRAIHPVIRHRT
ncbi:MAG: hypothetical protein WBP66_14530, partial [Azonexus sp.]